MNRVIFIAISLTFPCNDARCHPNRLVRPDEGNCEIVREGSKACATPSPNPVWPDQEAWLNLTNFKDRLAFIDR